MRKTTILFVTAVILTATTTTFGDLVTGLVANYTFSGNADDVSGNDHHGIVYGATLTTDRFGNSNSAYSFNGSSHYISVPYSDAFQLPVFTLSAWINASVDLSTIVSSHIVSRGEDDSSDEAAFGLGFGGETNPWGTGAFLIYEDDGDDDFVFDTGYYSPVGTWTHLAATRLADGQLNIYLNGSLLAHWDSSPVPTDDCFQDLIIGAYWYNSGTPELVAFFPGLIDEVRIYNRALNGDEIYDLYMVPLPGAILLGSIGLSLVGWRLRKREES